MNTTATLIINESEVKIELRHDADGRYRWYETATGADTEVSGETPEAAWEAAYKAWPDYDQWADSWDGKEKPEGYLNMRELKGYLRENLPGCRVALLSHGADQFTVEITRKSDGARIHDYSTHETDYTSPDSAVELLAAIKSKA